MKVTVRKKTLLYTHPVFVIGSYNKDDRPNIMAVSWGGICCSEPPCVAISLRKATYTYHNIMHSKAFTVNMPSVSQVNEADYAGIYSGRDENKFNSLGLTAIRSEVVNAPYVKEFPINMQCRVINILEIGLHTQFIGEVIETLADEAVLNHKGMPEMKKVNPFVYDSATRSYFGIGERIIKAYSQKKK